MEIKRLRAAPPKEVSWPARAAA